MKKGRLVIYLFCIALGTGSVFPGQGADSVLTLPASYHPISPFVVNPFPKIPTPIGALEDTLVSPIGLLDVSFGKKVVEVYIDPGWEFITFTEYLDGSIFRIPFTAPLDWYFTKSIQVNRHLKFTESLYLDKDGTKRTGTGRGSKSLEVVGVNLGTFGRASLRVRGNVNISGKLVFQDQELVRSSINETQNTHIEFDQKQNLNIEGKIGDRITVLMDQDSERDFDWENNIRISYEGAEDDILQKVEAGNISLSLPATQYVTFSGHNKGLFGIKAISKLGPIDFTSIASIEQTRKEQQRYTGGSEAKTQQIKDYQYVKNQYFFIHEWFRNGVRSDTLPNQSEKFFLIPPFYPLVNGVHPIGNVKVSNFELYKLDLSNNPAADIGVAYIDPSNPDAFSNENEDGNFLWMERDVDYTLSEDLGFIRLRSRSSEEILGCHYTLVDEITGDTVLTVGQGIAPEDTTGELILKMIKPKSPNPGHPTWDLMFKNVYYLGTTNINEEGFVVRIVNDHLTPPSDRDKLGIPYLIYFGLDSLNENGDNQSDEIIDMANANIVNLTTGELIFPSLYPFVYKDSLSGGNSNENLAGVLGKGKMYTSTISSEYTGDSRFTIEADYSNPSSTINLGFMLVEGSEEVLLNGIALKRGVDYQIDYFSGTIVLGEAASDPNATIEVLYDKHELVSFDKKIIIGTRAQMDLGKNSFLGATALYYDQSVINEKIEVGYEPTRNFIWDLNGRFEMNMEGLTRAIDKLPIIETEKVSSFSIEGELAQVLPNPNPINNASTGDPGGVAFIDDFEGAKRTTSPTIQRRNWKESSAPLDSLGNPYPQKYRAHMYWYNPYTQVRTKDIWPNQSTSIRAQNETTDILILRYQTRTHQSGVNPDSIWAGIATSFYSGDYDQTQSKLFEIWVKGTEGKLTVDLGKISEDWNGNKKLDTEDIPESGLTLGNGFLEDHEDVGVDGCPDEYEDGLGGCFEYLIVVDGEVVKTVGDNDGDKLIDEETWNGLDDDGDGLIDEDIDRTVLLPGVSENDPNRDNWNYSEGSTNYSQANGTEGNGTGSQIQEGGKYPDTEDLDRSGFLDKNNDYFTKTFALTDTTYLAGETVKNGTPTGWRLFRIPLSHFEKNDTTKEKIWNEIRYLRLVWTGVDSQAVLQIARIELVGNEWQEMGVAADSSMTFTEDDSVFSIAVVNTEDNADYIPPKGVKGEYDRINEIRAKEQSLVLKFTELEGGNRVAANKTLLSLTGDRAKSYLTYNRMKMYVYGRSPAIQKYETDVEFFMRFGLGDDFYEITEPVYDGWDESEGRNSIDLDLKWLTKLKLQNEANVTKYRDTDIFVDSLDVKKYYFTDEDGNLTGKRIQIKGQPALSRIQYIIVGVHNTSGSPVTGEVWIDELRLSGIKKDRGIAMRVQSKFNLADIGSASLAYSRKDADFHKLQQRLGTNSTSEDMRINANIQLHKLLPKFLGLNLPLTASFSNTVNRPKYFPGTDVLVNVENPPDSILTITRKVNFSTNVSKSGKSDNKLIKYTLDNLKGNFSASWTNKSNEIMAEEQHENYSGKLSYSLSFGRDNYINPMKWLGFLPLIGEKVSKVQLYYTPSSITTSLDFNEKLVQKLSRGGSRTPDDYNLGLNRSFGLDYKLLNNLSIKYNQTAKSDMDSFRGYTWMAIRDLDPGIVTNVTENLTTSYSPELLSWFRPNFNYSAGYRWERPLSSTVDGANIGAQLRFSSNVSLSLSNLFELIYKPPTKQRSSGSGRRRRGKTDEVPEGEQKEEQKSNPILTNLHGIIKKIDPISVSFSENLSRTGQGVQGTVPTGYKFGWLPDHGLSHSGSVGINTGNWDHKLDITLRSGVKLPFNTSISFNVAQNISRTISGSGVEQRSISRDYLAFGDKLDKRIPFVGWSLRMTRLEGLPLLKKFVKSASLEHAFSGKETRSWQFENMDVPEMNFFGMSSFIATYGEYEKQARVNVSFSPLIGITMSLPKGISVNIRANLSQSLEEMPTGNTFKSDTTLSASANYSHKGGFTIPLPFMEDFNIQNNMNFTFNFDLNRSATWGTKDKKSWAEQTFNKGWKTGLRVSYSFSRNVNGGVIYEYRESDSKTTGKKIDRDFGFDVNIAISG